MRERKRIEADHGGADSRLAQPMTDAAKTASLAERLVAGDKRALARAITLIESDDPAGWELVREVYPRTGKARIVGFTGPPGVGKSTLIGALTAELRKAERQVAVLSIDPSSPFTHGALLGDRIRLSDHFLDPGVFIRSMASRGALGGLSEAALQVALVMDAAGKDDVLIETVGVGQAEIDIVDHADTIVLALMPGSGDSIQALKAGVMEIPDVIVVNKADHPMTDTMVREVRGVLALSHDPEGWKVPILRTEAARGRGGRRAGRGDRRAPRPHRGRRDAGAAPRPQPAQRGARDRRLADAPAAGGDGRRATPRPPSCWSGWCGASSTPPAPPRSCSRGRPMAESPSRRRPRWSEARGWVGYGVDDVRRRRRRPGPRRSSSTPRAASPTWLIAKLGPLRQDAGGDPVARLRRGRRAASGSPTSARTIRSAPVVDPARPLLREHELTICAHYGIGERVGRAAEVAGRPEGAVTAQPAAESSLFSSRSSLVFGMMPA